MLLIYIIINYNIMLWQSKLKVIGVGLHYDIQLLHRISKHLVESNTYIATS